MSAWKFGSSCIEVLLSVSSATCKFLLDSVKRLCNCIVSSTWLKTYTATSNARWIVRSSEIHSTRCRSLTSSRVSKPSRIWWIDWMNAFIMFSCARCQLDSTWSVFILIIFVDERVVSKVFLDVKVRLALWQSILYLRSVSLSLSTETVHEFDTPTPVFLIICHSRVGLFLKLFCLVKSRLGVLLQSVCHPVEGVKSFSFSSTKLIPSRFFPQQVATHNTR